MFDVSFRWSVQYSWLSPMQLYIKLLLHFCEGISKNQATVNFFAHVIYQQQADVKYKTNELVT